MVSKASFLLWWLGGLAIFAGSLALHAPLAIDAVPGGILDHQAAPDAAHANAIQNAWNKAGLLPVASRAMLSDLVFIGIYGLGCVLGGLYFRASGGGVLSALGWVALISGAIFLVTDYGETIAQFIQLQRLQGDDDLASFASRMGPAKIVSFLVSFVALLTALIWERVSLRGT